jgi:hypothetical protein
MQTQATGRSGNYQPACRAPKADLVELRAKIVTRLENTPSYNSHTQQ